MAGYFSPEAVVKLHSEHLSIREKCASLRKRYILHPFTQERAREHARHGLCRRLGMLLRCIDVVFDLLPPELEAIPDENMVDDATIAIHSFVLNTYGCLDNMAWIWVYEKNVRDEDGSELTPKKVGMGSEYKIVRKSFSDNFRAYLETRKDWFRHLKGFRDSLAHRIPLYILPFVVNRQHAEEYNRLEKAWGEALGKGDFDECDRIKDQQRPYTFFRPWMTHSIYESAKIVVFHSQLLADFLTIDEIATKLLGECSQKEKATAHEES